MRVRLFHILLVLSALLIKEQAKAVIHTVSNDPDKPAMYTSLTAAHNAASGNDTIFIFGSAYTYTGNFTCQKPLYIYGNGYNPTTGAQRSFFSVNSTWTFTTGSSGTVVEGITWEVGTNTSIVLNAAVNVTVRNCRVNRCDIGGSDGNLTLINNFVRMGTTTSAILLAQSTSGLGTIHAYNNVLILSNNGGNAWLFSNLRNAVVANNTILKVNAGTGVMNTGSNFANNTFTNNIFYNIQTLSSNCDNCVFNNNLIHGCIDCDLITGTQTGQDNVFEEPMFVNYFGGTFNESSTNIQLQPASPGIGMGTDGADVGIFGGNHPVSPGTFHGLMLKMQPYYVAFNVLNTLLQFEISGPLEVEAEVIIYNE